MPSIQQSGAKQILRIIQAHQGEEKPLTYTDVANLLGRTPPASHATTIGQMCNLLDAAACFANVPMLALVAIREKSGALNPKAWEKEYGDRKELIFKRSLEHYFSDDDFIRIGNALEQLGEMGAQSAWAYLFERYPLEVMYLRLTESYGDSTSDAVADLGSDLADRAWSQGWSYARNAEIRNLVIKRAAGRCEYCSEPGFLKLNGTRYLEAHHIIALAKDGADKLTNVIALCANHHREAHFSKEAPNIEEKMMAIVRKLYPKRDN